ncbi:acyltransferase family protein [Luteimonas qiangzhengi]|uniref:acyltransferase family protein n=1 Tax=Luteimonas sp. MJ146 TaxID=3129240 RepID=UPI0031BB362F
MAEPKDSNRLYFPHIEGLRAVAALLVAVYHIYLGRVSGGVDVFFVVSGFLITLSLLHKVDTSGRLQWKGFLSGLALRLLPAAGLVLVLTVALTFLFLPEARYFETMREVLASFLYVENWQLAVQAVDYLDRDNEQSPVQHYWAMSVQGQFYLISICVFFAAIQVARWLSRELLPTLAAAYFAIVAVSLGYSIYQTYFGNQVWAYYDTFARVWEFCLGGLFGLAVHVRRDLSLPALLGWVGLLAIVLVGMIFQVGSVFPGAAALVPTLAAILVLFGGRSDARWSVGRLLGSAPLLSLGAVSYGIYLLHWPLLVVYREVAQVTSVALVPGLMIILVSVIGAYAIRNWVEAPFLRVRKKELPARRRAITVLGVPLFVGFAGLFTWHAFPKEPTPVEVDEFPGARVLDGSAQWQADLEPGEFIPDLATVKRDLPRSSRDGCHARLNTDEAAWCVYGENEAHVRTIAVVGGSHSQHWLPALEEIAKRNDWRIVYSTWSMCRFEIPSRLPGSGGASRCNKIMEGAMRFLVEDARPDLVFTTANSGPHHRPPDRFITPWAILNEAGIRVAAIRDNPWMQDDVSDCVSRASGDLSHCGAQRSDVLADDFDAALAPGNVNVIDLTNYFCNDEHCPPVVGKTLVYRDRHHLTTPYVLSLQEELENALLAVMEEQAPREQRELPGLRAPAPTELMERSRREVGIQEEIRELWESAFPPSGTPVERRIAAVLECGPAGSAPPFERSMEVQVAGHEMIAVSGDWRRRESDFDAWRGRLEGSTIRFRGHYQTGNYPTRPVELHGTYEDGGLELAGTRGPRACTLRARDR